MKDKIDFQLGLLSWFFKNCRDLPWRETYAPYHVWISEVMLQQTQVDRVIGYFNRWIERFPDTLSIARADEDEVLKLWEGLGYYHRAKNIYKAARILADNGGTPPNSYKDLLRLPGIGPYTAAAIMSLAYNEDYAVVDANVERVYSRIFNVKTPVKDRQSIAYIKARADKLVPCGNARYFNQALMELGALVCTPSRPLCEQCPVAHACESLRLGIVDERPVPGKSNQIVKIEMCTGLLLENNRLFIQKRPQHGVWANLWEFPGGRLEKGESPEDALVREYWEETELNIRLGEKITVIKHAFTRYRVTLHCFFCNLDGKISEPVLHEAREYKWVRPEELQRYAFPSPHRMLIDFVLENKMLLSRCHAAVS